MAPSGGVGDNTSRTESRRETPFCTRGRAGAVFAAPCRAPAHASMATTLWGYCHNVLLRVLQPRQGPPPQRLVSSASSTGEVRTRVGRLGRAGKAGHGRAGLGRVPVGWWRSRAALRLLLACRAVGIVCSMPQCSESRLAAIPRSSPAQIRFIFINKS